MEAILLLIRIFLAAVFVLAGVGKLLDLEGSEKAVKNFGVPDELAEPLAFLLPGAELLAAFLLLPLATAWFGALAAAVLLAAFIIGMLVQMAKGNAPDCHCFGAIHSEPVSKKSLARNAVFMGFALVLLVRGTKGQGIGLTELSNEMVIELFVGLATVALLVAIVFYLKQISAQQVQIIRRIEIMELVSHEGVQEVKRDDAGHPHDSLPIGARTPSFELPDLAGKKVRLEQLTASAKPKVFFFVSPTCGPCQALLPEIAEWKSELGDTVEFVFFSSGKAAANIEKFGDENRVLLQEHQEVAELFYAKWTPTAVFVNAEGLIASHLAVGDQGIRGLMMAVKNLDFSSPNLHISAGDESKLGAKVPAFTLPDLDGREITSASLEGKKTLVTFWSTTCPHCIRMTDELVAWDRERGAGDPSLLVFSKGEAAENRAIGLRSPVVLDQDYKVAEEFGMFGTPSAVLVDESGTIISETATGAGNIWALVGKRNK